jgi:hypothetical protein
MRYLSSGRKQTTTRSTPRISKKPATGNRFLPPRTRWFSRSERCPPTAHQNGRTGFLTEVHLVLARGAGCLDVPLLDEDRHRETDHQPDKGEHTLIVACFSHTISSLSGRLIGISTVVTASFESHSLAGCVRVRFQSPTLPIQVAISRARASL